MRNDPNYLRLVWRELRDDSPPDQYGISAAGLAVFEELRVGKPLNLVVEELDATGYFEQYGWDLKKIRRAVESLVLKASFCSQTYPAFLKIAFENRLCFTLQDKAVAPGVPRKADLTLRRFSPIRDLSGDFVDTEQFCHQLRSKRSLIDVYAARVMRLDDPNGLRWFLKLPDVIKRLESVERRTWLNEVSKHNDGYCMSVDVTEAVALWIQEGEFSYRRYYQDLLGSVDSNDAIAKMGVVYVPEHTSKIGTEMLIELLDSRRQDARYLPLTYQLIRDGSDWHQAFMISAHGRGIIHDLAISRQAPAEKLAAVMALKGFAPGKIAALAKGVDENVLLDYAKTYNQADEMYKLSGRRCLAPLVSAKVRDLIIAGDLGI